MSITPEQDAAAQAVLAHSAELLRLQEQAAADLERMRQIAEESKNASQS